MFGVPNVQQVIDAFLGRDQCYVAATGKVMADNEEGPEIDELTGHGSISVVVSDDHAQLRLFRSDMGEYTEIQFSAQTTHDEKPQLVAYVSYDGLDLMNNG